MYQTQHDQRGFTADMQAGILEGQDKVLTSYHQGCILSS